jgi:phosphopentomutase
LRFDVQASALLDAGAEAGPFPGLGDFRRDRETAALALHFLRAKRPRFLFLGLGETDEYAHRNDYRGYLHALVQSDRVIGEVAAALAELEADGRRTTLFVTTDHGRSASFTGHGESAPESADVWLVASGFGIGARGPVSGAGPRRLADVATTIRLLAGVGEPHVSSAPLTELLDAGAERLASVR